MQIERETTGDGRVVVLRVSGRLDVDHARALYDEIRRLAARRGVRQVTADLAGVDAIDSAGVVVLELAGPMFARAGKAFSVDNLPPEHRAAVELVRSAQPARSPLQAPPRLTERVGERGFLAWSELSALSAMIASTFGDMARWIARRQRIPRGAIVEQAVRIGADALAIVALLSWLLGLVLAFQSIHQLRRFGADLYMADIVGISMVREFGPLLAAIILAGRSGSAIAAELGTMVVREEVAALETMGIRAGGYLVLPRMIAIIVTGPALAVMAMGFGIAGGTTLAEFTTLSARVFLTRVCEVVSVGDLGVGIGKSVLFAWIVGCAGTFAGLRTRGAAHSVGQSTTRAVVASIFFIIIADSLITTITTRTWS